MQADATAVTTLFTAAAALVASVATLVGVIFTHSRVNETKDIAAAGKNQGEATAAAVEKIVNGGSSSSPAAGAPSSPSSTSPGGSDAG